MFQTIRNPLAKNILATLAYYDALDYPLSAFEIWKYLLRFDYAEGSLPGDVFSLAEVATQLQDEALKSFICSRNGMWFLKGREELVAKRVARAKVSMPKLRRLKRTVSWLRFVPFVRMVAVTGTLAMKHAKANSDWDTLIVLKEGALWRGRTLLTILLHLGGKRRHGKHITNRVCLNYFATTEGMEVPAKDLYSSSEYMFILPLFGCRMFKSFQARNHWISKIRPNFSISTTCSSLCLEDSVFSRSLRTAGEALFSFQMLEKWLRVAEYAKIMRNPKTHRQGSFIHVCENALIFLPSPHGPRVFERFKKTIESLIS